MVSAFLKFFPQVFKWFVYDFDNEQKSYTVLNECGLKLTYCLQRLLVSVFVLLYTNFLQWLRKRLPLTGSFFFSIYFYSLEANYFTILWWFLTYIDMNQPRIYMLEAKDHVLSCTISRGSSVLHFRDRHRLQENRVHLEFIQGTHFHGICWSQNKFT